MSCTFVHWWWTSIVPNITCPEAFIPDWSVKTIVCPMFWKRNKIKQIFVQIEHLGHLIPWLPFRMCTASGLCVKRRPRLCSWLHLCAKPHLRCHLQDREPHDQSQHTDNRMQELDPLSNCFTHADRCLKVRGW